jgi:WD40 repeat protein
MLPALWAILWTEEPLTAQSKTPPVLKLLDEQRMEVKHHVNSLRFSPDGKLLVVGGDNLFFFDLTGEKPKLKGEIPTRIFTTARCFSFTPDGKWLAVACGDHTLRIIDVEKMKEVTSIKEHKGPVQTVAFSPDGTLLASGSNDKSIMLWEINDQGELKEQSVIKPDDKFGSSVETVAFDPKGKSLVSACSNGTFRTFTLGKMNKQTSAFKSARTDGDLRLDVAPNGTFWAYTFGKSVRLINAKGQEYGEFTGHKEEVTQVAISPDNRHVASVSQDGYFAVWNSSTRKVVASKDRPGRFNAVAFSPVIDSEGAMQVVGGLQDGGLFLLKIGPDKK